MRPNNDEMAQAWHGDEAIAVIAKRHNMTEKQVITLWRNLKRIGRLPMGERSKYGREPPDADYDGRPKVTSLWRSDPLLEKLQRGER